MAHEKITPPVNKLMAERKLFFSNYENGRDVLDQITNEYPLHNVHQPGKGWLHLFFMQVANGTDPHELWRTYNCAHNAYREIVQENKPGAMSILSQEPPDSSAPQPVREDFEKKLNTAKSIMGMMEQLNSIFGNPESYESLIMTIKPSLERLVRSPGWVNKGQSFIFAKAASPVPQDVQLPAAIPPVLGSVKSPELVP